jgi:hypothetical protein
MRDCLGGVGAWVVLVVVRTVVARTWVFVRRFAGHVVGEVGLWFLCSEGTDMVIEDVEMC